MGLATHLWFARARLFGELSDLNKTNFSNCLHLSCFAGLLVMNVRNARAIVTRDVRNFWLPLIVPVYAAHLLVRNIRPASN